MVKEVMTHQKRKHWKITRIKDVPKGINVLDSVWTMRRKRNIDTGSAGIMQGGGQQQHGVNIWET